MSTTPPQTTMAQEWESFKNPAAREVAPAPQVGEKAPVHPNLKLPSDKPVLIVFLRHCGCPFAEKAFKDLTALSTRHPSLHCVAVSHSSAEATERWVVQVGGTWDVEVVVDEERELYAQFGLPVSSSWHVLSPMVAYQAVQLGNAHGIWNRPTESGTRWQTAGAFALDRAGFVRWASVATMAYDTPRLDEAVAALGLDDAEAVAASRKRAPSDARH